MLEPALPLEEVEYDVSVEETGDISSMSAEQYLSWVRHQANALPDVCRAEIHLTSSKQTVYMPSIESIPSLPQQLQSNATWEEDTLFTFSELRNYIGRLESVKPLKERSISVPALKDIKSWNYFCFGDDDDDVNISDSEISHDDADADDDRDEDIATSLEQKKLALNELLDHVHGDDYTMAISDTSKEITNGVESATLAWSGPINMPPTLTLLLQFDQVMTQRILKYQIEALSRKTLTSERCAWMYALLARVEKPLHRDTVAMLRQLYRTASTRRVDLIQPFLQRMSTNENNNRKEKRKLKQQQNQQHQQQGGKKSYSDLLLQYQQLSNSQASKAPPSHNNILPVGGTYATASNFCDSLPKEIQDEFSRLTLLVLIAGSYFGQGEEYADKYFFHEPPRPVETDAGHDQEADDFSVNYGCNQQQLNGDHQFGHVEANTNELEEGEDDEVCSI